MFNKYFIIVYIYFFLSYLIINIKILNINHNNERKINSFVNRTENAINNSDTFEDIKYQK